MTDGGLLPWTRQKGRGYNKNRGRPYRPCPGRCYNPRNGAPRFVYEDLIKDDTYCYHCGTHYGGRAVKAHTPVNESEGKGGGKGKSNGRDVGAASSPASVPISDFVLDNFSKQVLSAGLDYAEAVKHLNLKGQALGKFAKLCNKAVQPVSPTTDPLKDNQRSISDKVNKLNQLVTKRLPSLMQATDECVTMINQLQVDIDAEKVQRVKLLDEERLKALPAPPQSSDDSFVPVTMSSFNDWLRNYLNDPGCFGRLEGHMQGLKSGTITFDCPPPVPHPSLSLDADVCEFGDMDPNARSDAIMRSEGKRGRDESVDPGDAFTNFGFPRLGQDFVEDPTGNAAVGVSGEELLGSAAKKASTAASSGGAQPPPPAPFDPQAVAKSMSAALAIIQQHDANVAPTPSCL